MCSVIPLLTCWHILLFGEPCSQLPVNSSDYMMLLLPLYALLTSILVIFTLTSSLVPFGLSICQYTFTISSTLSNGHLSIAFHPDDFIDAYLTHNNWVQCCLTTLDPITWLTLIHKYSCSPPNFWESLPHVNVPCPVLGFPVEPVTGPNSMILVSIEREKSDLQDYVIRIWIESLLACVYSKWSILFVFAP